MEQREVESRLETVQQQLKGQRDQAKAALDAAFEEDPEACTELIARLSETNERFRAFQEVTSKALPLLRTLADIDRLRRDAVDQLARLEEQSRQSRRIKEALGRTDLERIETIPQHVGESFDLSLLDEGQLRMIREARDALGPVGGAPAPEPAPAAEPAPASEPAPAPDPTPAAVAADPAEPLAMGDPGPAPGSEPDLLDQLELGPDEDPDTASGIVLEPAAGSPAPPDLDSDPPETPSQILDTSAADLVADAAYAESDQDVEGELSGDDALDAMFEEALSATEDHLAQSSDPEPTEAAAGGSDPLDELLTRAGFEGEAG